MPHELAGPVKGRRCTERPRREEVVVVCVCVGVGGEGVLHARIVQTELQSRKEKGAEFWRLLPILLSVVEEFLPTYLTVFLSQEKDSHLFPKRGSASLFLGRVLLPPTALNPSSTTPSSLSSLGLPMAVFLLSFLLPPQPV